MKVIQGNIMFLHSVPSSLISYLFLFPFPFKRFLQSQEKTLVRTCEEKEKSWKKWFQGNNISQSECVVKSSAERNITLIRLLQVLRWKKWLYMWHVCCLDLQSVCPYDIHFTNDLNELYSQVDISPALLRSVTLSTCLCYISQSQVEHNQGKGIAVHIASSTCQNFSILFLLWYKPINSTTWHSIGQVPKHLGWLT